ncbi:MAG: MBOAT family protein [Cyanobacteria bacterium SIG26]|nr:MBOAT family protein [Cyanobacteria bacterium SIG26]
MLFSSMSFVFMFLPIVLVLYLITKKEFHNPILLAASILFYAWGEPKYLAIMLLTILVNYLGALAITNYEKQRKLALILTLFGNLGFLIYFKYFNFLIENFNNIFQLHINTLGIIMPIGISFYTFQALSYVIDVYRKEVQAQKDLYKLALYICLFPQLIAGPIVKYHDVAEQIDSRDVNFEKVSYGVKRFIIGLSKKMLIANTMGAVADRIFSQNPYLFDHSIAWIGSITYSLQLYFDFSGYSDMAIGLGMIFGFRFMENFNYPYISKSITEFWRRWHISLSTWFKEYVYISLGGNRCSKIKNLRNLGIVFLLTGIWHGAAWNFIIWGIWHGFFIILEKLINIKQVQESQTLWWQKMLWHIYCIFVFVIGWVMFRADNMEYAWNYIMNMFGILNIKTEEFLFTNYYYYDRYEIIIFIIGILCSIPIFKNILNQKTKWQQAFVNVWLLFLFLLSTMAIAAGTYNPFIYFRF